MKPDLVVNTFSQGWVGAQCECGQQIRVEAKHYGSEVETRAALQEQVNKHLQEKNGAHSS